MTVVKVRCGLPEGWNERHKEYTSLNLPDGAEFYSTPSHGFLRVDVSKLPAKVSGFDYIDGQFVLLEEDCSATMWLAERGLIPMQDYIKRFIADIPRQEVKFK